jgi:hypothetical protein
MIEIFIVGLAGVDCPTSELDLLIMSRFFMIIFVIMLIAQEREQYFELS